MPLSLIIFDDGKIREKFSSIFSNFTETDIKMIRR